MMPLFHETGSTQENNMNNKHEMFLFSCTLYYMEYSQVNYSFIHSLVFSP